MTERIELNQHIYIFGESTIEVIPSHDFDPPFKRIQEKPKCH